MDDWLKSALLEEVKSRRERQEKVFGWSTAAMLSIIAGVIALKTHPEHPRDLGGLYSSLSTVVVVLLAVGAILWMQHHWKMEVQARSTLPPNFVAAITPKKVSLPHGYDLPVVILALITIVAIWLPALKKPNQAPEPTRAAVTIPAKAGLAPAARVAHL